MDKVLLFTSPFSPNVGGVETHLDDLIAEGSKRGVIFRVITYQPLVTKAKGYAKEVRGSAIIYRIPWPRFNLFLRLIQYPILEFLYLFPGLMTGGFLFLLFDFKDVKVIHAHGLVAGAVGVILSKLFNKKVIISTHSIYGFPKIGLYKRFVCLLFSSADKILTLSHQSKNEVVGLGINPDKVHVFTYWVDQKIFRPGNKSKSRDILGFDENGFICLFVGRLIKEKGVLLLVEIAQHLKGSNIYITLVGDGPLSSLITDSSKKINNLIFFGKVANNKLPLYYQAADVLLVPSVHEEGFGRVILEALSCGLPVMGSNRGAIPEAINEKVGITVDATTSEFKKNIESLYRNRKKLEVMARNSRMYAQERYNSENINDIIKHY